MAPNRRPQPRRVRSSRYAQPERDPVQQRHRELSLQVKSTISEGRRHTGVSLPDRETADLRDGFPLASGLPYGQLQREQPIEGHEPTAGDSGPKPPV